MSYRCTNKRCRKWSNHVITYGKTRKGKEVTVSRKCAICEHEHVNQPRRKKVKTRDKIAEMGVRVIRDE